MFWTRKVTPMGFEQPKYMQPTVISRFWSPDEAGEKLAGAFLGVCSEPGQYGEQQYVGVLDALTKRERVVRLSQGLGVQLDAMKPLIGDGMVIEYLGQDVDGRRGRQYKLRIDQAFDDRARKAAEALLTEFSDAAKMKKKKNEEAPF